MARPWDDFTQVTTAGWGGRGAGVHIPAGSAPRPDPLLPERLRHITLVSSSTYICKQHRIYPLRGSRGPGTLEALPYPCLFQTHNSASQMLLLLRRKEQVLWG